jgi:hypothetical protein
MDRYDWGRHHPEENERIVSKLDDDLQRAFLAERLYLCKEYDMDDDTAHSYVYYAISVAQRRMAEKYFIDTYCREK